MKKLIFLLNAIMVLTVSAQAKASADAELRLFQGSSDFDLKQIISISSDSGQVTVTNYKKVCNAYSGCNAVLDGTLKGIDGVSLQDLYDLKLAIGGFDNNAKWITGTPIKSDICGFYTRFLYQFVNSAGEIVKIAEFENCTGKRIEGAQAETIERVLNLGASNAGL